MAPALRSCGCGLAEPVSGKGQVKARGMCWQVPSDCEFMLVANLTESGSSGGWASGQAVEGHLDSS